MQEIDLSKGDVSVRLTVKFDNAVLGYVNLLVIEHGSELGGHPNCYVEFIPYDPNEPEADSL